MASSWNQVPNWTSFENQGGGVAVVDLDGDGRPELIVLRVDHPTPGPNQAFYRVGKSLDGNGLVTGGWGNWIEIPNWGSVEDQGSGLAVADLDKDGRPELIVLHVEHQTPGPNRGQYRIGKGLDAQGNVTGGWGNWIDVPGWNADADEGAALAIGDVDGDGSLDLVVFHMMDVTVPDPNRPNKGFYRLGKAIDGNGVVTGGWGDWIEVDWFSWSNQGAGLALADLDGNNRPELIVFQVDNPPGLNSGFYRIGWNLERRRRSPGRLGPVGRGPQLGLVGRPGGRLRSGHTHPRAAAEGADLPCRQPSWAQRRLLPSRRPRRRSRHRVDTGCLAAPAVFLRGAAGPRGNAAHGKSSILRRFGEQCVPVQLAGLRQRGQGHLHQCRLGLREQHVRSPSHAPKRRRREPPHRLFLLRPLFPARRQDRRRRWHRGVRHEYQERKNGRRRPRLLRQQRCA